MSGTDAFADFSRAPNIADNHETYELENRAIDPSGVLWQALRDQADWHGRTIVDLGCGTGFWLPRYATDAARVIGVEPDSVDVIHARFAYFFPPHCEPGLHEALRVLRPGGALVVVDNDWRHGEFAELLRASAWATAQGAAETTDEWWRTRATHRVEVMSAWRCADPAQLESVLRIEFPGDIVDGWLRDHPGRAELSYGYVLFGTRK
jgi:SAM-dependent methyltransferase